MEDSNDGTYGYPNETFGLFTYVPTVGQSYSPNHLCQEFSFQAKEQSFPIRLLFANNKFVFECPYAFRVTDREYSESDGFIGNTYVGARYGECFRFFNHLQINAQTSYQYPYDPGQVYQSLESSTEVFNYIGYVPIPEKPAGLIFDFDSENPQLLHLSWTPNVAYQTSVYLADVTTDPNAPLVNWDLLPALETEYKVLNLLPGRTYKVGIGFVSDYDESGITISNNTLEIPDPVPEVFNMLAAGSPVTATINFGDNEYTTIFNGGSSWPANLTQVSQIVSLEVKFYANIFAGSPSDARVLINGDDSRLLYYMYWRYVALDIRDPNNTSQYFSTAFASTLNSQTGTLGPLDDLLVYDTLYINDPAQLSLLFSDGPNLLASPPNLTMFVGYLGSRIEINSQGNISGTPVPVVEKFMLKYKLI